MSALETGLAAGRVARRSRAIGPAGTAARVLLGGYIVGSVVEAEITHGFTPVMWAIGLIAFPGVLLAAQWAWARRGGANCRRPARSRT
jgi:hypothetical protein